MSCLVLRKYRDQIGFFNHSLTATTSFLNLTKIAIILLFLVLSHTHTKCVSFTSDITTEEIIEPGLQLTIAAPSSMSISWAALTDVDGRLGV